MIIDIGSRAVRIVCRRPSALWPRPGSSRIETAAVTVVLGVLLSGFALSTTAAAPRGPVLAHLQAMQLQGLQRETFAVSAPTKVQVDAVGLADPDGKAFLSQGWILDLDSRDPVWTMEKAGGSYDGKTGNWKVSSEITLDPGPYAVYFATYGGVFPIHKKIKVLGFTVGRVDAEWGRVIDWDEEGTPEEWGIKVQAVDAGARKTDVKVDIRGQDPDAVIRVLDLPNQYMERIRLDLDRPLEMRVAFTGEYSRSSKAFADAVWLTERSTWDTVWEPEYETTRPAGGVDKNRRFNGVIRVPAGSYLLNVVTDASHAAGNWNTIPPWDPESWGVIMDPVDPADRTALQVERHAGLPEPTVKIARVGNSEWIRKEFTVTAPTRTLARVYGERVGRSDPWADRGWIERVADLEPIWRADKAADRYGGGADKNRLVEEVVALEPGAYALCYFTDDSHAYGSWNAEPPWEPEAWGVSLTELGAGEGQPSPRTGRIRTDLQAAGPAVVSLAPARSSQTLVKRFKVKETTRLLLVAIGEGQDSKMYDYGWIVDEDRDVKIWQMRYEDSRWAGGGKKNREVRAAIELPPGSYAAYYATDDSHAFGDWNDWPPNQPGLWGLTLVEQSK